MPPGIRASQGEDGTLLFSIPICEDRFIKIFLPLFGIPFFLAGLHELIAKHDPVGWFPLACGALFLWFGGYMALGRLELRLGPEGLEWTRIYLRRWSAYRVEKAAIASVGTEVAVRSNGHPSAWRIAFRLAEGERSGMPGSYREAVILWLGGILTRWAGLPFDAKLDRSYEASD